MSLWIDMDTYNDRKVNKILRKYDHKLTFSAYRELKEETEVCDAVIRKWFDISFQQFNFFKQNHIEVLGVKFK